jgi:predicted HAD superfamily Cof-like phosphohydrolase
LLPGNVSDAEAVAKRVANLADETANLAFETDDLLLHRAAMALEELAEWLTAHAQGDLVAVADAWADREYVLLGDAVAGGLPAIELFAEVHRSNMTKEPDSAGTGKAIKGPAYTPPNIRRVLDSK